MIQRNTNTFYSLLFLAALVLAPSASLAQVAESDSIDGVDEVDQVGIIVGRFIGFEVIGPLAPVHHVFVGLLVGAFPSEVARPGTFVQVAGIVAESRLYEGLVDEFAVVSHAPIFAVDVESNEVAANAWIVALVHGVGG